MNTKIDVENINKTKNNKNKKGTSYKSAKIAEKENKKDYNPFEWTDLLIDCPIFILRGIWYIIQMLGHCVFYLLRGIGHFFHHIFDLFD